MPTNDKPNRPPLSAWQFQSLRLTSFPSPDSQISGHDWWAEVVGEPPEKITSQPRTGEQLTEGLYENGRLVLNVHPLRIDWRWDAAEELSLEHVKFPILGPFVSSLETFRELARRWFKSDTPPLVRLALGAVLLQPIEDRAKGYRQLSNYLPFSPDSEGASDFLYQINRPRNSSIGPNLKINRLSKWSVAVFGNVQLSLAGGANQVLIDPSTSLYACRLELDINTAQEYEGTLPSNNMSQIFDKLIELGTEIAEQGDIP